MDNKDTAIAAVTAGILRNGRLINYISLVLTALVLAQMLFKGWTLCLAPVLLLGLFEFWFAARVELDAALFEKIADCRLDTKSLDDALLRLKLIKEGKTGRSMEDRARGAMRLLKLQMLCLLAQTATSLGCIILCQGAF